jgi:uncharacterized protein DUF3592
MIPIRKNDWLWLALGVAVIAYGMITGGGPVGWLMYWELEAWGIIFPETYVVLAFLLVILPLIRIAKHSRRWTAPLNLAGKRYTVIGLILAGIAGLCFLRTILLPSVDAPPQRLVLDDISATASVPEHESILVGTPQRKYRVRYTESLRGRASGGVSFAHNFIPVTGSAWTPDQPVRFLIDGSDPAASGLLLGGKLPGYVRMALEKKGLRIAGDAMVLSSDPDFGRVQWYVIAAFASIGAAVFLLIGFLVPWAQSKPAKEMEELGPRIARHFAFSIGGAIILLSAVLAIQKIVHITSAASAEGVITSTLENSHDAGKYSYFVEYTTPAGHYERQAHTSTPISKNVGDKVVVIYDRGDPQNSEILIFDSDWILDLIVFLPGAVIVVVGAIVFRPRKAGRITLIQN